MALIIKQAQGTTTQLYQDALGIRKEVFVVEQHVPLAIEVDANDARAVNYVGYWAGQPVATARVVVEPDGGWHIQRVATIKSARHHGYGQAVLAEIAAAAQAQQVPYLILAAQLSAQGFYERLGYQATARPIFLDANIKHQEMKQTLTRQNQ
ncbi:GNAT family N-acetyltransferase [Lapidilactobacillus achengensis]|uniref:GNAT family N-acetyltransferase n=1 Tax=Lapidilactobacillus achengensis TaxID=2486000 RepID=A0ABW1UM85_9LACO|nr:GNAT family N-acetyltransferase [Lapidilactobacillus achengensis]